MKISNQQNYNYKNPNFGYNFPKYINEYPRGAYCTTEESFRTRFTSYMKNGCMEAYYKLYNNIQKFINARFDATQLIEEYRPIMQQYGVEDKFDEFLNKFNAPVDEKGKKDFSKIDASVSDVFIDKYKKKLNKPERVSGDLGEYFYHTTRSRGSLHIFGASTGFSVGCGRFSVVGTVIAGSECFAKKYLADDCFDNLQKDIDDAISKFFIEKCEKLKKEGEKLKKKAAKSIRNMSDADIKKRVDTDINKLFKAASEN